MPKSVIALLLSILFLSSAADASDLKFYTTVRAGQGITSIADGRYFDSMVSFRHSPEEANVNLTDTAASIAGGWEYEEYGLRGEIELSHNYQSDFSQQYTGIVLLPGPPGSQKIVTETVAVKMTVTTLVAVLYRDIRLAENLNIFGGIGAGLAFSKVEATPILNPSPLTHDSSTKPVAALAAGMSWDLTPSLTLEARYRVFTQQKLSTSLETPCCVGGFAPGSSYRMNVRLQDAMAGIRYQF